jgi:TPR repeat protein
MSIKQAPSAIVQLAESGDPLAQEWLGDHLRNRELHEQAVRWYAQAAAQGSASASYNLGWMYYHGRGVEQDYATALRLWHQAGLQPMPRALGSIGLLHERGEGVPQDYAEAARWYLLAAEQGDAPANWFLGRLYARGLGVPRDAERSLRHLRRAAEQAHRSAQYSLAAALLERDDPALLDEALHWLRQAADAAHADAQFMLGRMLADGDRVPADAALGARLLQQAAAQGHAQAVAELARHTRSATEQGARLWAQAITQCHLGTLRQLATMADADWNPARWTQEQVAAAFDCVEQLREALDAVYRP